MGKEILTLILILKLKNINFTANKTPIFLKDVDIEKVLVSNKTCFGEKNYKYFIGYLFNDNKLKPLHIILPKTSAYIKSYDGQTKWMYSLIEDEKYNTILGKFSADIKKRI